MRTDYKCLPYIRVKKKSFQMETNERTMWKKAADKQVINGKSYFSYGTEELYGFLPTAKEKAQWFLW